MFFILCENWFAVTAGAKRVCVCACARACVRSCVIMWHRHMHICFFSWRWQKFFAFLAQQAAILKPTPEAHAAQRGQRAHAHTPATAHTSSHWNRCTVNIASHLQAHLHSRLAPSSSLQLLIVLSLFLFHKLQTPTDSLLPTWPIIPVFFFIIFFFKAACSRFSCNYVSQLICPHVVQFCCPRIVWPISSLFSSCSISLTWLCQNCWIRPFLMTHSPRFPITDTEPICVLKCIEHMHPSSTPTLSCRRFSLRLTDAEDSGCTVAGVSVFPLYFTDFCVSGGWSQFSNSICVSRAGIQNRPS